MAVPKFDEINTLKNQGLTWAQISEKLKCSRDTARGIWRRYRDATSQQGCVEVIGVASETTILTPAQLWQQAITAQLSVFDILKRRRTEQVIKIQPPCAFAFLSDEHFGSPFTDYQALKDDAELIRDTPGMYCGLGGDGVDNWIVPKLAKLQRQQVLSFDGEWQLFFAWLEMLRGKVLYVLSGNHENWTRQTAGIDRVRDAIRGAMVLYHPTEIIFTLKIGPVSYVVKARHSWPFGSVFNTTHSIEVGWERGGVDFDIGIGCHTHTGTFYREFTRHGKKRIALLTGTYKVGDEYAAEIGAAATQGRGCGALVFDKDGQITWCEELKRAANYLTFLRSQ